MKNEIKLIKNNDGKEWTDLEWVDEFYRFLQGEIPGGIEIGRGHAIKLSPQKAMTVIWYLQEHFALLPDHIERCSVCNELFDTYATGFHSEENEKHYCGGCMEQAPDF